MHGLIGHVLDSGSDDAGVNAMAWDPHHLFQLASASDDCTVHLWDIHKVGGPPGSVMAVAYSSQSNGGSSRMG